MRTRRKPWSPQALLAAGLLLILIALAFAAWPTYVFARHMFRDATVPVAQFDANTETTIAFPDTDTRYIVAQVVDSPEEQIAPVEIALKSGVATTDTEAVSGWFTAMGRYHRNVMLLTALESRPATLTLGPDPQADFVVFRYPEDAVSLRVRRALPYWIGAAVPLLAGLVFVAVGLVRITRAVERAAADL